MDIRISQRSIRMEAIAKLKKGSKVSYLRQGQEYPSPTTQLRKKSNLHISANNKPAP